MDLRCLVFSSNRDAAAPICQVLKELGGDAEHCLDNVAAVQRVAAEPFQIVIADWDDQPDAEFLLKAVRARKASDRPLTLAIVSDDTSVPKALQAGANSILRKPILVNQVKETLQTARSLLKARHDSSNAAAASIAAQPAMVSPAAETPNEAHLRAGEFLQSAGPAPASQIDTESEMQKSIVEMAASQVDTLKDLEPTAAAVPQPVPPAAHDEPRGLEWYLKRRGIVPGGAAPAAAAPAPAPEKPELLGFESPITSRAPQASAAAETPRASEPNTAEEQKEEKELFAYMAGEGKEPREGGKQRFRLGKRAVVTAAVLAACAMVAAPQAPWHGQERALWARGRQALHAWLNPQLVTPAQAPVSHEDFGRAGDEYKLPVAETIPDATTDPSQIKVTPMVDPTAKKPNGATGDQPAPDGTAPDQPIPAQPIQVQEVPTPGNSSSNPTTPAPTTASNTPPAASPASTASAPVVNTTSAPVAPPHADPFPTKPSPSLPAQPRAQAAITAPKSNTSIPTSLKSQMVSATPDMSGNKSPETALPSIEPVDVPEATERGLITAQPAIAYPASAKGQQGTVVLLVLVGRDGSVQDAKFLQGSLAFARAAIDGVKQWSFKPYVMNGRPVSVQTKLTLSFQAGQ